MAGGSTAAGFNPQLPGLRYIILSKALGATMWFFIFYRARKDGSKFLFGAAEHMKQEASHH